MGFYSRFIFPSIIDYMMSGEETRRVRAALLSGVHGRVFEIGFGTGLNLEHYPPTVDRITTADVNPGMNRRASRRLARSDIRVDCRILSAESIPVDDESFDSVVCTWTLCSIEDPMKALSEIRRILRPKGSLFFAEHGLSDDEAVQKWQNRLTPIWKRLGLGCRLNRDARTMIQDAHFNISELRNYYLAGDPRWLGYTYQGTAVKP